MKRLARIAAHLLFACGMLVFLAMPANRYGWMQEMDPSMATLPVDGSVGSRTIFTVLLLAAMLGAQLAIMLRSNNRRERIISLVLMLVAIATWSWSFWR
jgi:hypothetical protein